MIKKRSRKEEYLKERKEGDREERRKAGRATRYLINRGIEDACKIKGVR